MVFLVLGKIVKEMFTQQVKNVDTVGVCNDVTCYGTHFISFKRALACMLPHTCHSDGGGANHKEPHCAAKFDANAIQT